MATPAWRPLTRNYERETQAIQAELSSATSHPLLTIRPAPKPTVTIVDKTPASSSSSSMKASKSSTSLSDPLVDPLSGALSDPLSDPLSPSRPQQVIDDPLSASLSSSASIGSKATTTSSTESKSQNLENTRQAAKEIHESNLNTPWQSKKQQIRKDYVVTGNVTVISSAIYEFAGSGVEDGSSTRKVDKYDKRLANLEKRSNSAEEKIELSQREYENHVSQLSQDLARAWANDERVGSLKIAIQLAKLLSDTNFPLFYPSMFVMVSEELDKFGDMVYKRLLAKAEEALNSNNNAATNTKQKFKLAVDFTSADIPIIAKETCRNWFYKVACIRELLPRIYVEMALLRCYRLLTDTDMPSIINRLSTIIRGVGDPLVSFYARLYLLVTTNQFFPQVANHAMPLLQDTVFSFPMMKDQSFIQDLEKKKISMKTYQYLLAPAVEWMLKSVGKNSNKESFQAVLQIYRDYGNESLLLKNIIDCFEGSLYAHAALGMITLIKAAEVNCYTTVDLFAALGKQLAIYPPPEDQRLQVLNDVWKVVSKATDTAGYIRCTSVWLDVVQKHYTEREMVVLLGSFSSRLASSGADVLDPLMPVIEGLLTSLIGQSSTFGTAVLTSEHFLRILDVFKGVKKVQMCKDILLSFKTQKSTNDPVLINTIFDLARIIHDSVDGLSTAADVAANATLLCGFIDQIDFGKDLEQQLNFYVECRSAFANMEQVKDKLIVSVSNLAMKAYRYVKGKHTKKTTNFVKAALAYCHITIPSLSDVFRRLELLLLCAQVALLNQCLPQTDTFLKAAITLIPDVNTHFEHEGVRYHYEDRLAEYINNLLSFLVVTPGHPEHGPFYIVQGLINAIPKFSWNPLHTHQSRIYINMLALLCTFAQKNFPYHIQGVQSNDELYGGAIGYMNQLEELISVCIAELLKQMTALGENNEPTAKILQAKAALDLVNVLGSYMEMKQDIVEFMYKLIDLANRQKSNLTRQDAKYLSSTIEFVIRKLKDSVDDFAAIAISKLQGMLK